VLSQLAGTFILAQCARGWLIVDQHAAHERILYQEMLANLGEQGLSSQLLLQPLTLELNLQEAEVYAAHEDLWERLGFLCEPFGERTLLLRGVPQLLNNRHEEGSLRELLDLLEPEKKGQSPGVELLLQTALVSLSCRGALRANTWLSTPQQDELLQTLSQTPHADTCPHGRPTYRLLELGELDRWFQRS